jgi:Ca-activated chloride channel family protein
MHSRVLWGIACVMALIFPVAVDFGSQERFPEVGTLRVDVSLVTVGVRVTNSKGREIGGLGAERFTLYEDGVAQQIALFSSEEEPITLCILMDRSRSMEATDKFDRAKEAARLLVESIHPQSEYIYMAFDDQWQFMTFTQNRNRIRMFIDTTGLGNGTALYDAMLASLQECRRGQYGRRALVAITDGADQHSLHNLDDLIRGLQESQVQLYTIGYFSGNEEEIFRTSGPKVSLEGGKEVDNPKLVFRRLALESGAEDYFPTSDQDLQSAVEEIARDLASQYTLSYYPSDPSPSDRYRRITVKVNVPGVSVRARQGYILPKATTPMP